MTVGATCQDTATRLTAALHLDVVPIAITLSSGGANVVPPFADLATPMPEPTADGRTDISALRRGCEEIVTAIESAASINATVARYAAADAERFAVQV